MFTGSASSLSPAVLVEKALFLCSGTICHGTLLPTNALHLLEAGFCSVAHRVYLSEHH